MKKSPFFLFYFTLDQANKTNINPLSINCNFEISITFTGLLMYVPIFKSSISFLPFLLFFSAFSFPPLVARSVFPKHSFHPVTPLAFHWKQDKVLALSLVFKIFYSLTLIHFMCLFCLLHCIAKVFNLKPELLVCFFVVD